ncbi:hypothetical protein, partial [Streptococcus agalactiae]|uniref:hypothetical protein n=1 Tax=Streptococcus agalactiae TaxID=1311 RepID=UPI00344C8BC2
QVSGEELDKFTVRLDSHRKSNSRGQNQLVITLCLYSQINQRGPNMLVGSFLNKGEHMTQDYICYR